MAEENKNQINIELTNEIAQGTYANLAIISHSSAEFVMDFIRVLPGLPKAQVKSRIIMTPEHAKRLMMALQDNVLRYESQFGKIKNTDGAGSNTLPLFGAAPTEA
ncbi:MAG: DUF3467 domain-containing protein [Bacteroidales bacterium]|jgi:hypothetical protein|nr:DUF3467 domain-containing protein [Bacteroidales bacterium]MCR4560086.1 DUF3467 domain-containing protein [Bacteroidales bacterium]